MSKSQDSGKKPTPTGTPKEDEGKTGSAQPSAPDSKKIDLTHAHRQMRQFMGDISKLRYVSTFSFSGPNDDDFPPLPFFRRTVPPRLKAVYVNQMEEDYEWVYSNRILRVTLIEDPLTGFVATNVLGQDAKGDAVRVSIYNIPQNEQFGMLLAFGTKLGIIDPYHRVAVDGKDGIRVDDPTTVVHLGWVKNMCRYCGGKDAQRRCANCKVSYCDRACQLADWKLLKHKIICKK